PEPGYRTVRGNSFDKNQPAAFSVVKNDIGHFPVGIDGHPQAAERIQVRMDPLLSRISHVQKLRSSQEGRGKDLDDLLYQFTVGAAAQFENSAIIEMNGNSLNITALCV